jgi:hypothetical protein
VIERKAPGREIESKPNQGWAWPELDQVDEEQGGAPRAQLDALKLLAVFMQHGDNRAQQQRLVCLDPEEREEDDAPAERCARPFLIVQDVGLTFGRADKLYRTRNHVNLARWSTTPIWTDDESCRGELIRPFFATLERPRIGEDGRAFLAGLLDQLGDDQIRDLFDVARVTRRPIDPRAETPEPATLEDWVRAFKDKRDQISRRRCEAQSP